MNTRITTLAASTTLAIFAATSLGAETSGQLGSDRDNASIRSADSVQAKAPKADQPTLTGNRYQVRRADAAGYGLGSNRDNASIQDAGGVRAKAPKAEQPTLTGNRYQVRRADAAGYGLGSNRDNASIQDAGGVQAKAPKADQPTFTGNRPQARRAGGDAANGLGSDRDNTGGLGQMDGQTANHDRDNAGAPPQISTESVKYGYEGNTLMMAGEFEASGEERPGRCGTDDHNWESDEYQFQGVRFTVEIPLELKSDGSSKTYLTAHRPYIALGMFGEAEGSSPELTGSIHGGRDGRVEIGTFSYSENEYEFTSAPRVQLTKLAGYPVLLSLDGMDGVGFYGEMDFDGAFELTDDRDRKVQDLNFSQWESQQDEEEAQFGVYGDLTGDGMVNQGDFSRMLAAWGTEEGDLNGDGTTDGQDLGLLIQELDSCWG